jgi:hypothetical protein
MVQTLFYFVTLLDSYKKNLVDNGSDFCRKFYFYSGKLVFLSKFGFEIKNNIFKQSYALVLEKFEIFTLFYIWVDIKWIYSKITAT